MIGINLVGTDIIINLVGTDIIKLTVTCDGGY